MKTTKSTILSVKGTRDFYPEDMAVRIWLYDKIRKVSESFGYQEYEGPILESIDLYAAKSGEELVKEQSYVFPDRDGDLITLRPELTPTLARMVAKRQRELIYPLRWWSYGPFWRYERPQKGRTREFFQWNIDLIGVVSPQADAEIVAIVAAFFQEVGLSSSEVSILVNNRKLMDSELVALGIPAENRQSIFRLIDRRDKMQEAEWEEYASDLVLNKGQIRGIKSLLADYNLWQKSEELVRFFRAIEAHGVTDFVRYEPGIIRGLDYYTGTVFEAVELEGDFRRSILGGGRYDNLLEAVGGEPLPAMGFAMGDVIITLILEKHNLLPIERGASKSQVLVTIFDDASQDASISLAAELRKADINVSCYPEVAKLSRQLKFADRNNLRLAIILGAEELSKGIVSIKDLHTGDQRIVPRSEAAAIILQMLASAKPS